MLKDSVLDPQGQAVLRITKEQGLDSIQDIRVGKNIEVQIQAKDLEEAKQIGESLAKKVLVNEVIEVFKLQVHPE